MQDNYFLIAQRVAVVEQQVIDTKERMTGLATRSDIEALHKDFTSIAQSLIDIKGDIRAVKEEFMPEVARKYSQEAIALMQREIAQREEDARTDWGGMLKRAVTILAPPILILIAAQIFGADTQEAIQHAADYGF